MKNDSGGFLLSHTLPGAVPSAFTGLASRFGMETGRFPVAMTTAKISANLQNTLVTTKMVYHQCLLHTHSPLGCFVCGVGSGLHSSYEQTGFLLVMLFGCF